MKYFVLGTIAAFALSACASTADMADEKAEMTTETKVECAILNPDGSCACEVVDANGDCVEGGGAGVIVSGGNN